MPTKQEDIQDYHSASKTGVGGIKKFKESQTAQKNTGSGRK